MTNKIYIFSGILIILLCVSNVFATTNSNPSFNINLALSSGTLSNSQILMWNGNQIQVIGVDFQSGEKYTLVYLEDKNIPSSSTCDRRTPGCQIRPGASQYSSTRYPKIKCIMEGITASPEGFVSKSLTYNYLTLANDKKAEKLYVVLSKDVKCKTGTMIHWNPKQYLSGTETI